MTVKEMIDRLRIHCEIELRDFENILICKTNTDCKGVVPYLNYEVVSWFVKASNEMAFCVLVDDREADNDKI